MALTVISGTIAAQPLNDNFSEGKNNFDTHKAELTPHSTSTNLIKTTGNWTMAGALTALRVTSNSSTGRQIFAGSWADLSNNSGGMALYANNAYTDGGNDFRFAQTHPTLGARGIRLSTFGVEFFDTGSIATVADAIFTPVWKKMWHAGNAGPFNAGSGAPEGVVTAPVGAIFQRTDGGASTTLYVKESGVGNTGWVAK